jgi:hypothetical protein
MSQENFGSDQLCYVIDAVYAVPRTWDMQILEVHHVS